MPGSTKSPNISSVGSRLRWARHDPFFDLAEILSWMQVLPRMEVHILDGGHKLLEMHADAAAPLMVDFVRRTQRMNAAPR